MSNYVPEQDRARVLALTTTGDIADGGDGKDGTSVSYLVNLAERGWTPVDSDPDDLAARFEAFLAGETNQIEATFNRRPADISEPGETMTAGSAIRLQGCLRILCLRSSDGALAAVERREPTPDAIDWSGVAVGDLLQSLRAAIFAISRSGEIAMLNGPARRLINAGTAQAPFPWPERSVLRSRRIGGPRRGLDLVRRLIAGELFCDEPAEIATPGGARLLSVDSAPIESGDSPLVGVLIVHDVTEETALHRQLERVNRLEALGQVSGGIAHEYGDILSTAQLSIQMASYDNEDSAVEENLSAALTALSRARELNRRLLAFAVRRPGVASPACLKDAFTDVTPLIARTLRHAVRVEVALEEPDLHAFCDAEQLQTVILNLVLNAWDAIEHSGVGGVIRIHGRTASNVGSGAMFPSGAGERFVDIVVQDDGPGMTPDILERATEAFFTTKSEKGGAGLGLAMVESYARRSGGDMRITSNGRGVTATVRLPRAAPTAGRETIVPDASLAHGAGETVLLVEDDDALRSATLSAMILLGYKPIACANGAEALDILSSAVKIDSVITDVVMPGGPDGYELAERTRALRPDLRFAFMSGYDGSARAHPRTGDAPFLRKPCSVQELGAALRRITAKRRLSG